ncbi:MAG: carboxy-S-adenosyl-L-methionine synthase CmoA [Marinicellaceae bacterium]
MENHNNQKNSNSNVCEDNIFEQQFESVKAFAFDQQVTSVFDDMIKRSVPGYESILKSIAMFCMKYAQSDSHIYDLGCSLGAVSVTAARATESIACDIVAVDTSEPMLNSCQKIIDDAGLQHRISLLNEDITSLKINNASVVISNFTIQFIPKEYRLAVIKDIYDGLNSGGVFILSEKFQADDENDNFLIQHYHAYKKLNGYSNKAIQRKRDALKNVLVPDSIYEIENRLNTVGFKNYYKWFQCFNFASFIAIKD